MHPSESIKGALSQKLEGRTIVLGISGGIACVECVKLARQLIRHGAEVIPVMTDEACRFISPMTMEFATGNAAITGLSGKTEHVSIDFDLLLVAPCTANTLSKIALGIADNALTTFALTARKMLLAPSMHLSMYENEVLQRHIERCRERGILFVPPEMGERKAKMAGIERIVADALRAIRAGRGGKRVLIIGGATGEPLDDVRVITNLSSGKMARALAMEAYERGMDVEAWASFPMPPYITTEHFTSIHDLLGLIKRERTYDAVINCAAISDFTVAKQKGKIKSGKKMTVTLEPAPRVNPLLRKMAKTVIGFKLAENESEVIPQATELVEKDDLDYAIGNTIESLGSDSVRIWIVGKKGPVRETSGKKEEVAMEILDLI